MKKDIMVIKLQVEKVEQVEAMTFSTKEEANAFKQQYRRRLKDKAKQKGIKTWMKPGGNI